MYTEDVNILISDLITNNFLNEERFAEAFVSGKFRIKKWGKIKIKQQLKQKKISDYSINKGLAQISDKDYLQTMEELLKAKRVTAKNDWEKNAKLKRYLASKGYESSIIHEVVG